MGLITSCILVLLTFQLVLGQRSTAPTSSSPSSTSTSSASRATVTISVGAEGLSFTPDDVTANVGDIVEFTFYPQNHSVARSDFKSPCIPYEDTAVGRQGFWSGFKPISVVLSQPPTFQILINDTEPIFFYCSAPGACIDNQMVGVINANDTETLDIQKAYAKNATLMISPGQNFPLEIAPSAPSATFSTSAASTPTATALPTAVSTAKPALSTGEIVGIAVGGSAIFLLAAILLYLCGRQRTMGELIQQNQASHIQSSYLLGPGNVSVASSSTYPKKANHMNGGHIHRWSTAQRPRYNRICERVPPDMESFRSRSPPVDETRGYAVPVTTHSLGTTGPVDETRGYAMPVTTRSPGTTRPVDENRGYSVPVTTRSPGTARAVDESRGYAMPITRASPGTTSPHRACSPLFSRPVPESPDRQNMSPISPLEEETFFQPLGQSFGTEHLGYSAQEPLRRESIPPPLRVHRYKPQRGPYELSVESSRGYLPYQPPEYRNGAW